MSAKIKIAVPAKESLHRTMGGICCAKRCGYNCTREQYDAAFEACNAALLQMQADGINRDGQWTGEVWDSGGWHWRIVSGGSFGWQLTKNRAGMWECYSYSDIKIPSQVWSGEFINPIDAIRDAIRILNETIELIKVARSSLTDGIV